MKIAIVGLGYWGPNLVRNFIATSGIEEVSCFDTKQERIGVVRRRYPHIKTYSTYEEVLKSDVDAIALATPVSSHFQLGKKALESGKHLLIEKPMASSVRECEELVTLAAKNNLILMVDHTFLYTGAVRKMEECITQGLLGDIYYFDSVRVNLGLFQHDVNVIWDLAPHDISIMDYVLKQNPVAVSAIGSHHINETEDVAYLTVHFESELLAHFHVNWLAPVKIRRILIGGSKQMILYDDMQPSEKLRVYDKGVDITTQEGIYSTLVQYRTGDMYAPKIDDVEALSLLTSDFVNAIRTKSKPLADGVAGLRVVRILEAADKSIQNGGKLITL
ncbi:MAG: Gfo/Idh/MocA family oxidoreductase [Ignavibacteriales bacterium]|nr:Gfo/Idh/MocA family oxidoreductase [Ignavibacteriales bacterium]